MRSHSPPIKGRGRGGVCNILSMRKILTPPQPLPYKGWEGLRIDYSPFFFSCPDFLKWTQLFTVQRNDFFSYSALDY